MVTVRIMGGKDDGQFSLQYSDDNKTNTFNNDGNEGLVKSSVSSKQALTSTVRQV